MLIQIHICRIVSMSKDFSTHSLTQILLQSFSQNRSAMQLGVKENLGVMDRSSSLFNISLRSYLIFHNPYLFIIFHHFFIHDKLKRLTE